MKQANMVADFRKDKALALGENVISYINSGHYTLPLTELKEVISGLDKPNSKIVLVAHNERSRKKKDYLKPSLTVCPSQSISITESFNKAGQPWSSSNVLKSVIMKVIKSCDTCGRITNGNKAFRKCSYGFKVL